MYTLYSDHTSPPPTHPRSSPSPTHPIHALSLFKKQTRTKKCTTKTKPKIYKQNTNKTKNAPQKQIETKSLQKFQWVRFVLANYSPGIRYTLKCDQLDAIEENEFFLCSRYQLQVVSSLRVGNHVHLPLLDPARLLKINGQWNSDLQVSFISSKNQPICNR